MVYLSYIYIYVVHNPPTSCDDALRFQEPPLETTATTAGTAEVTEEAQEPCFPDPPSDTVEIWEPYGIIWNPKNCNFLVEFSRHKKKLSNFVGGTSGNRIMRGISPVMSTSY